MTIEQKSVILAAIGLASRALEIADRAIAACTGNMTASDAAFVQAIEETLEKHRPSPEAALNLVEELGKAADVFPPAADPEVPVTKRDRQPVGDRPVLEPKAPTPVVSKLKRVPQKPVCKHCGRAYPSKTDAFYQHQSRCGRKVQSARRAG